MNFVFFLPVTFLCANDASIIHAQNATMMKAVGRSGRYLKGARRGLQGSWSVSCNNGECEESGTPPSGAANTAFNPDNIFQNMFGQFGTTNPTTTAPQQGNNNAGNNNGGVFDSSNSMSQMPAWMSDFMSGFGFGR